MNFDTIIAEVTTDKIGLITLNRPDKRNALSIKMRNEISACLKNWIETPDVGVVIFCGAGTTFSTGYDLKEFGQPNLLKDIYHSSTIYHRDIWNFPKPTIAAVKNHALGGATDLITLCDIRICSESTVFGHPEIKFGAPPLFTPLRWIIGNAMARDLCLTGRKIDSKEAYRLGLVSEVVEETALLDRAVQLGKTILEAPLETLKLVKSYMISDTGLGFEESFVNEHDKPFESMLSMLK